MPVVLLGTFAVLGLFGFSINMLTMFAMVLAIGLLVDDAIVVVENVERIMAEEGLSPREATAKSMDQITSALIGIGLVLSAVFGPMAFFPGSTGVIYRQFSVTIIASMLLSVVVALILTPVLCASLLQAGAQGTRAGRERLLPFCARSSAGSTAIFFWIRDRYVGLVGHSLAKETALPGRLCSARRRGRLPVLAAAHAPISRTRTKGSFSAQILMPTGTTLEQTQAVADEVQRYFQEDEKEAVESCLTISGIGFSGTSAEQRHGVRQVEGLEAARSAGSEGTGRCRPGHGGVFQVSATPWSSPSRRPPSSSWATPGASISS